MLYHKITINSSARPRGRLWLRICSIPFVALSFLLYWCISVWCNFICLLYWDSKWLNAPFTPLTIHTNSVSGTLVIIPLCAHFSLVSSALYDTQPSNSYWATIVLALRRHSPGSVFVEEIKIEEIKNLKTCCSQIPLRF